MLRSRPIGKQFWESGVSPEEGKEGYTVGRTCKGFKPGMKEWGRWMIFSGCRCIVDMRLYTASQKTRRDAIFNVRSKADMG